MRKTNYYKHLKVGKQAEIGVLTHPSNSRKPFIIGLVAIGAIIILALLVLLGPKMVGKAFYTGEENTAGIEEDIFLPATYFAVVVKANIGAKETVAVGFEMSYPESLICDDIQSNLVWTEATGAVLTEASCDNTNHKVIFRYATLNTDSASTRVFPLAKIMFGGVPAGNYNLDFTSFNIIDLNSDTQADLIADGIDATIVVRQTLPSCASGLIYSTASPATDKCVSAIGIKIDLTEIGPSGNVFATKITAKEGFPTTDLFIYTTLQDANGKILAFKKEIVQGMNAEQDYVASVNYPGTGVKKKIVTVYDKLAGQGMIINGALTVNY